MIISVSRKISGAEISLESWIKNNSSKRLNITVVMPPNSDLYMKIEGLVDLKVFNLISLNKSDKLFYIIINLLKILWTSFELSKFINNNSIDIIYSNTSKAHVYGCLLKFFTGKKLVWHVRDKIPDRLLNFIFIYFSDKIVCVSNFISSQFKIKSKKINVAYPVVKVEDRKLEKNYSCNLRDELGLSNQINIVAQISQLTSWKNHSHFVEMAHLMIKKNQLVHFIIVGDNLSEIDSLCKEQLESQILALKMDKHISLLGFRTDVKAILGQTDILVHPAAIEPFGRVIVEAMGSKIPVVSINSGGAAEIIEDKKTGFLVNEGDFKSLACKTELLLNDKKMRLQMGCLGYELVKVKFDTADQVSALNEILETC